MKPRSKFWPISASLVSFVAGIDVTWNYFLGDGLLMASNPLAVVANVFVGVVPILLGATLAQKTLRRLGVVTSLKNTWQHRKRCGWARLSAAMASVIAGAACSIWVIVGLGDPGVVALFVPVVVLPVYAGLSIAGRVVARRRPRPSSPAQRFITIWAIMLAAFSLIGGCVMTYMALSSLRSSAQSYLPWIVELAVRGIALLPAIWGALVAMSLVDIKEVWSFLLRPDAAAACRRFLAGIVVSAILGAIYVAAYWGTFTVRDWRSIYFASVLCAIPAAIGLWAGARVVKKAEHAR